MRILVDVAPLRDEARKQVASGVVTVGELAAWSGYVHNKRRLMGGAPKADCTAFQRALGLKPRHKTGHDLQWAEKINYANAVRIAEALRLDPVDVGL